MRHAWLLDVLTDLRGFARGEGYLRLAEQIDDALTVAAGEIVAGGDDAEPDLSNPFARPQTPERRTH